MKHLRNTMWELSSAEAAALRRCAGWYWTAADLPSSGVLWNLRHQLVGREILTRLRMIGDGMYELEDVPQEVIFTGVPADFIQPGSEADLHVEALLTSSRLLDSA